MKEQNSHNSLPVTGRSTWRYFMASITALVTLSLAAVGLAVQAGPQVVVVRGEFAVSSTAAGGAPGDEVLRSAAAPRAKIVASPGGVSSLVRIAPDPTATTAPLPTPTSVPAAEVPVTVVPSTPVAPTAVYAVATRVPAAPPVVLPVEAPTLAPVAPTAVAVVPTAVPVAPTAVPVVPTAVAVVPTAVAVVPTAVPVVPTAVPAVIPVVQPVGPARSGPAGVVRQIPNSAWRWLDAHNWTVEWRQGPGPARVSEAQYATNTIVIWYDTARSDTFWAGAFGHELGHAVSWVHFSDVQTSEWNAQRGFSSWRWVPGMPNDFHVGEGDFAEAFMGYLFGHQIRSAGGPLSQADRAWIAANTPF